jgi:predicted nucleic acid-binding protein
MLYFFDTSALQHRYINTPKSRGIRRTISDSRNKCYAASITVLEIASAFALHCRKHNLTRVDFRRLDRLFWEDVKSGVLQLRETGQREYRKAQHLLEYAGVELRRSIKSADALIAATCLELALEKSTRVKFCLEDWTLFDITSELSAYKFAIQFRFIGTRRRGVVMPDEAGREPA